MEERLNKWLSQMGVCSRREADRLIEAGKVLVDNRMETAIKGLFAAGDGAGITRGLMQAGVSGMVVADEVARRLNG